MQMRYLILFFAISIMAVGGFFLFSNNYKTFEITPFSSSTKALATQNKNVKAVNPDADIEPQKPLPNPPKEIKAVYATAWSAGTPNKIDYLIKLIKETELNAIIIDIKDFSGYIAYDTDLFEIEKYKAEEIKIKKINSLIKKLHDENIYVIARITIFQDPILAKARPDLAIHSKSKLQENNIDIGNSAIKQFSNKTLWLDHKKLAWIDPSAKDAWDYNIAIAKDAANRGFDELNFDYIRFASDGNLNDMIFPFYDNKTPKNEIIKNFFSYLREKTKGAKISADLFGLSTINNDDLGIGQVIEDAYQYFDYVSPMVYPSHYANSFLGYKNPANYPYEVVKYSMEKAVKRLIDYKLQAMATSTASTSSTIENWKLEIRNSQLRPWLQNFDLGADYDAKMVRKQIQAVYDAASSTPELINGWMLWDPKNEYTRDALLNPDN